MNRGWRGRGRPPRGGQRGRGFRGANNRGGGGFPPQHAPRGRGACLDLHGMGSGPAVPHHLPNPAGPRDIPPHDIPPHEPHHGHVGGGVGSMDIGMADFQVGIQFRLFVMSSNFDNHSIRFNSPIFLLFFILHYI